MTNQLAMMGLTLGLTTELSFLNEEEDPPQHRAFLPPPRWERPTTPDQQFEDACLWFASCAVSPHPREVRKKFRIVPLEHHVLKDECSANLDVLMVSATEIRRWYLIDSDRDFGISHAQLNGLFGFLQAVVWPMWVNDWGSSRIQIETGLPNVIDAAVERYRHFEATKRELLRESIANVLALHPRSKMLYEAAVTEDLTKLRQYLWAWKLYRTGVDAKHLSDYVEFIVADDRKMIRERKAHIQYCLLMPLLKKRIEQGRHEWRTPAYQQIDEQSQNQLAALSQVAKHYYSDGFRNFCLRDDVREMERSLFASTRMSTSKPYENLIMQLAESKNPLSIEQQLQCFGIG